MDLDTSLSESYISRGEILMRNSIKWLRHLICTLFVLLLRVEMLEGKMKHLIKYHGSYINLFIKMNNLIQYQGSYINRFIEFYL